MAATKSYAEKNGRMKIVIDLGTPPNANALLVAGLEGNGITSYKIENQGEGKKLLTLNGPYTSSEILGIVDSIKTDTLHKVTPFYLRQMA